MRIIIGAMRLKGNGAIQMSLPTVKQVLDGNIMAGGRCTNRHSVSQCPLKRKGNKADRGVC